MPSSMEKPQSQSQPQNHLHHLIPPPPPKHALNCPRCDSSNTKFCYYNNYSLSQPRHFCKACKRYWTRGGTLRNVPVGGGCRKNKRVKRSSSSSAAAVEGGASSMTNLNPNPSAPNSNSQSQNISISTSNPHQISPLFYGLPSNPSELNLPLFNSTIGTASGFELQPQLNALALGFSSGKQIQDAVTSSNSMLSNYSIFGSSLLASSLHQQQNKFSMKDNNFQQSALTPFEELRLNGNNSTATESGSGICLKEVKAELQDQQQSRFDWHNINQNHLMDQIGFSSLLDPSLYWNPNSSSTSVGAIWHDPANIGSSVTSLI